MKEVKNITVLGAGAMGAQIAAVAVEAGYIDDLLATGGTTRAVADLVQGFGAEVAGLAFVVELDFLHGRDKLAEFPIQSLVRYAS